MRNRFLIAAAALAAMIVTACGGDARQASVDTALARDSAPAIDSMTAGTSVIDSMTADTPATKHAVPRRPAPARPAPMRPKPATIHPDPIPTRRLPPS